MLTKAKMRVALALAAILGLGLLGPTDALCDLKNGDSAVCHTLSDVKNIDAMNLTILKTSVPEKTLTSTSLKYLSSSMKHLDLSGGEIEIVEPNAFSKMTGLVDLKLSDNYISQLKDSALTGLENLRNLDLRRNRIRQLPTALTKLTSLKNLEISANPLTCNCATLRVRDSLLANAVKISKKVYCATPTHFKGVSLLEPEAELICMFEEQDDEMQADEASGSGDGDDELFENNEDLIQSSPVPVDQGTDQTDVPPEIITDDLIIAKLGESGFEIPVEDSTSVSYDSDSSSSSDSSIEHSRTTEGDFEFSPDVDNTDDLIVEGSGVTEAEGNEGSGKDGSGSDELRTSDAPDYSIEFVSEDYNIESSTTEQPMTTTIGWFDVFGHIWNTISGEPDTTEPTVNGETEKSLTDEEFFPVVTEETTTQSSDILPKGDVPNIRIIESEVVTKKVDVQDTGILPTSSSPPLTKSDKVVEDFSPSEDNEDPTIDDKGEASTRQSKKSMGSYVVLAALLGVLAALVGFAAYKSSFCKKKPNNDPERGTELKDVQKPFLDSSNTNQAKISANGSKAESAPLVEQNPDGNWAGPQEVRQWTDNGTPTIDNGAKYTPSAVESDPIKPPRKSLPSYEEPNGLHEVKNQSPMSTFVPTTHKAKPNSVTPPNSPTSVVHDGNPSPPLSPNTQRVKITLQENPDSVPKTPILITRTKPGVNLVKSP